MTLLSVRREVGEFRKRYKWMALVALLSMSAIIVRLVQLQMIEHEHWVAEAEQNITKHVRLPATRGLIRDHAGKLVATNRPAYDVYMTPQLLDRGHVDQIARLMGFGEDEKNDLLQRLARIPERRRSHLVEIYSDITRDQFAALEMHKRELPGLRVVSVPVRTYPFAALGAHALGFLNEVNAEDIARFPERGYHAGDAIGRSGVEAAWESYLRGHDGELTVVVDVRGYEHDPGSPRSQLHESRREPTPGRDLRLTLDFEMMKVIERAFRGHPSGAAVVVDVRTGRVRALYSKPGYDLNEMSSGLSVERATEFEQSPFRPLIDKTVYETYFPGSTFKPISALAALQDAILTTATQFDCGGFYRLGNRRFRCGHAHGEIDLRKAIVQSCNVYFYQLAEQVGLDRLTRLSNDFGLGAVTGLGINTEARGFVPTRDWYMQRHQGRYRIGFTLNDAIGQGNTRVTLMQLAMVYAAIANGGTLYVPQLVQAVESPDGSMIEEFPPRVRRKVGVDPAHLSYVRDGMYGVVNDLNGTAFEARIAGGVPVAGKTGTAQVTPGKQRGSNPDMANAWYYRRSHAWFAGYAPASAPELAIVVLVEHGGHGGKYAAPIAIRVLQEALGGASTAHVATARGGAVSGGIAPALRGGAATAPAAKGGRP